MMAQAVFAEAVAKGTRMFNLLITSTVSKTGTTIPEQSAFTSYDDLASYGYHESSAPEPFTLKPLRECLVSLHVDHILSTKGGHNTRIYHEHSKDAIIDGIRYRVSRPFAIFIDAHKQSGNKRILLADRESRRRCAHCTG